MDKTQIEIFSAKVLTLNLWSLLTNIPINVTLQGKCFEYFAPHLKRLLIIGNTCPSFQPLTAMLFCVWSEGQDRTLLYIIFVSWTLIKRWEIWTKWQHEWSISFLAVTKNYQRNLETTSFPSYTGVVWSEICSWVARTRRSENPINRNCPQPIAWFRQQFETLNPKTKPWWGLCCRNEDSSDSQWNYTSLLQEHGIPAHHGSGHPQPCLHRQEPDTPYSCTCPFSKQLSAKPKTNNRYILDAISKCSMKAMWYVQQSAIEGM